jgi:hypothetical protein
MLCRGVVDSTRLGIRHDPRMISEASDITPVRSTPTMSDSVTHLQLAQLQSVRHIRDIWATFVTIVSLFNTYTQLWCIKLLCRIYQNALNIFCIKVNLCVMLTVSEREGRRACQVKETAG